MPAPMPVAIKSPVAGSGVVTTDDDAATQIEGSASDESTKSVTSSFTGIGPLGSSS
jgi:hypothetical protein